MPVFVVLVKMPALCQCGRNRSSLTHTHTCTQIDELHILFHGLCRWRKRMPVQKRSKPLCTEKQVSSSQQLSGRAEESLNRFMSLLTLRLFTVCPWLLCPARYLFLDPFFVKTVCAICASVFLSVCGKHKQRGKSMCPQAIKTKSIPFIQSIFRVE